MVAQFSSRYKPSLGRNLGKKGPGQKLTLGSWFWKLTGVVIISATLAGMAGSYWFSWNIRRGLDSLTGVQGEKHALQQVSNKLLGQKGQLLDRKRIETVAAAKLALYPTVEQSAGGGVIVRIPEP
ncbi:MAG: hypothetical protein KKC76_18030 [Proteobacteria bacterium]|nr:hypothetical protein [Pseudomonadota bacterium]MBU4294944.1 hypothetical protein [Pseudomonadota bacterium]MCG2747952.1 hypothetical protein [Desulfobulbaceae bacterium]